MYACMHVCMHVCIDQQLLQIFWESLLALRFCWNVCPLRLRSPSSEVKVWAWNGFFKRVVLRLFIFPSGYLRLERIQVVQNRNWVLCGLKHTLWRLGHSTTGISLCLLQDFLRFSKIFTGVVHRASCGKPHDTTEMLKASWETSWVPLLYCNGNKP